MSWFCTKKAAAAGVVAAVAAILVAGCTVPVPDGGAESPQETTTAAPPAMIDYSFAANATDVAPAAAKVSVSGGTLTKVVLVPGDGTTAPTDAAGTDGTADVTAAGETTTAAETSGDATAGEDLPAGAVPGTLNDAGTEWTPNAPLEYGQQYTAEVTAVNTDGKTQTDERTFSVVTPQETTTPTLMSSGGDELQSNREYGVGLVMSVRFDTAPNDRRAAEKYMHVTTEPALEGNWYWISPTQADWRPKDYYPTGTSVSVDIDVAGHDLGGGQYATGERQQVNFTIGAKRVAIADDNTKTVKLYENDQLIDEMPTSMGRGGYATYNGVTMHFFTQPGTYTVLDKSSQVIMDSTTYGLPLEAGGYRLPIDDAVRISNDGIYLHALDNIWAQGSYNESHGCLNLSPANAKRYFDWAVAGDVVEVRNTGGPPLEPWQNGSWSVPWEEWQTGEADFDGAGT